MRLRTKYVLFIGLLLLVALGLSYAVFKDNKILFIVSEIFILIAVMLSVQLYRDLLQPLRTLMTGIDALKSMEFNVRFRKTGKYEMDQLIDVYNQMADQLRIERTNQQQQHFFLDKLIATSPTGILILDYDDKVELVNPRALSLLHLEEHEIKSRSVIEINHPVLEQARLLKAGETKVISVSGVDTYKLQMAHFIDRGFARNFIMIEELTAEILAAEKKVYGKVIRMMAHEVNNTIGPVNSILQSALGNQLLWNAAETETLRNALQVALERNNNLNGFMRSLADLVKLPKPVKKSIEIRKVIANVMEFMFLQANRRNIVFQFVQQDVFFVEGDEQQLEQALINIVKNAIESIEENGIVSFYLDGVTRQLRITDTGKGIDQDMNDKLFSPFSSTKKDGQGIGLTLVREILLNHQFEFSLKTVQPGETVFLIQF